jgi:hypothetical protein
MLHAVTSVADPPRGCSPSTAPPANAWATGAGHAGGAGLAAAPAPFDDAGLMGWERRGGVAGEVAVESRRVREPVGAVRDRAFAGIHVVEPAILDHADRTGVFPIWELYLDLAERGFRVEPADVSAWEWLDVGTPERLREAEAGAGGQQRAADRAMFGTAAR